MKKWKPSASAKRQFAENMKNSVFASAYYERKENRAEKRRSTSNFDYETAGGQYVPTKIQADEAFNFLTSVELTNEQFNACNAVFSAHSCNEKTSHDNIHIVNELIRAK